MDDILNFRTKSDQHYDEIDFDFDRALIENHVDTHFISEKYTPWHCKKTWKKLVIISDRFLPIYIFFILSSE